MTGVRPVRRDDLPEVSALFAATLAPGVPWPAEPMDRHLARLLLDAPWADPDLPSLVAEGPDGTIHGFLGSYPRRWCLDGRPVRAGCVGGLVVHPQHQRTGVMRALLQRYLAGPQEFTVNDAANEASRRLFTALGFEVLGLASLRWRRVLHPGAAGAGSPWMARRPRALQRAGAVLAGPVDAVCDRVPALRDRLVPSTPGTRAEDIDAAALVELVASSGHRLRPDYDEPHLDDVFAELAARGDLVRHRVHGPDRRVLGWYVAVLTAGRVAQVLQLGASPSAVDAVLDHLVWHAAGAGAVAVEGRVEPELLPSLRRPGFSIAPAAWCAAHGADPALLALLGSSRSLVSRLDGEWWIGHLLWTARHGADHAGARR